MRIEIDTERKTITPKGNPNMKELVDFLQKKFPDWYDYELNTGGSDFLIPSYPQPFDLDDLKPSYPNPPYYPTTPQKMPWETYKVWCLSATNAYI